MRMEPVDNPRYPHHIRIIRKVLKDWLSDVESELGGVLEEDMQEDFVIYEGCGRSYTDTTTTGDARVDSNKRKASIPVRYDEWAANCRASSDDHNKGPRIPMSGDLLYVTKGNISEEWEVKDFEPDNDRSVVYGEMNRNFNME